MVVGDFELTFKESPMGFKCPALQIALRKIGQLPAKLGQMGFLLTREIERNLSGKILQRRTGRLWSSWTWEVNVANAGWKLIVGSDCVYARIHEFGGMTGRGHKTHIPARGYVSSAINKTRREIDDVLNTFVSRIFWN